MPGRIPTTPAALQAEAAALSRAGAPAAAPLGPGGDASGANGVKPRKLKGFAGGKEESWESYSIHLDIVRRVNGWNDTQTLAHFTSELTGEALLFFGSLAPAESEDCVVVLASMDQRFGTMQNLESVRDRLEGVKQKPDQSLEDLSQEVRRLAYRAYAAYPVEMREKEAVRKFMRAIASTEITRALIQRSPISSMRRATEIAVDTREMGVAFIGKPRLPVVRRLEACALPEGSESAEEDYGLESDELLEEVRALVSGSRYQGGGHRNYSAPRPDGDRPKRCCWLCGSDQHMAQQCLYRPANWPKWFLQDVQAVAKGQRVDRPSMNPAGGERQAEQVAQGPLAQPVVQTPAAPAALPLLARQVDTDLLVLRLANIVASQLTPTDSQAPSPLGHQGQPGGKRGRGRNWRKNQQGRQDPANPPDGNVTGDVSTSRRGDQATGPQNGGRQSPGLQNHPEGN